MGCCETSGTVSESSYPGIIKLGIEKNNFRLLKQLTTPSKKLSRETCLNILNNPITVYKSLRLNALGYSLVLGFCKVFSMLHKLGCNIQSMESLLVSQGITALEIICRCGYSELLTYYLPIYIENWSKGKKIIEKINQKTIVDPDFRADKDLNYTAIQIAAQHGHIQIMTLVFEFFKYSQKIPPELDLDHQDDVYGENCPLIACRYGNLVMIKYLHQKCKGNFLIKNKDGDNAVNIAASCSRSKPHLPYLQIIMYLVEVVGVDIKHNYEETLESTDNEEIIKYVQRKLEKIEASSKKNENVHKIERKTKDEAILVEKEKDRFNFLTMLSQSNSEKNDSQLFDSTDDKSLNIIFGSSLSEFYN